MPSKNLTASAINALAVTAQRYDVTDRKERGLTLRVYPSGEKVFRYRMRSLGKVVTIGPFSDTAKHGHVTIGQARARVEELRAARRAGPDTIAEVEKRIDLQIAPVAAASVGKTVSDVAAEFWKVLDHQRKRGHREAEPIYRKHVEPVIGGLALIEVKRSHCNEIVERAFAGGAKVHAAKVLALTKQLLDFGGRRFADDDFANPAARLKAADFGVRSNRRKRWLSETEIPAFWKALDAGAREDEQGGHELERRKMAAALRLLLLTALRTSELRLARWDHFDEKAATLIVPVSSQKLTPAQAEQAQDFVVPLPPLATALLKELRELGAGAPWVLPSAGSTTGAYDEKSIGRYMRGLFVGEPKRKVKAHPALAKLDPASPHDLRRTCRTWLGRLNVAPHVCERCLNHRLGRIVETYDRYDYLDERRAALAEWERTIKRLIHTGK